MMHELAELLAEVWSQRRRLALVVLGLVWGTLGLSVLLAFGEGFDHAMTAALGRSGDRMLRLQTGATRRPFAGQPAGRMVRMRPEDAAALRGLPEITAVSVEMVGNSRVFAATSGANANAPVHGVEAEYLAIRGLPLAPGGRWISRLDTDERRRVAVLGADLATDLFGSRDPVGREVRLLEQPFVVIGVLAKVPQVMTYAGDDRRKAFVPAATLQIIQGFRYAQIVLARVAAPERNAEAVASVRRLLGSRLGFAADDVGAIAVIDHVANAAQIRTIVTGTRWFQAIVGVLGLLVAALGVANFMYALVEERVQETGLRLALGAMPRQILCRQLLESACVTALGGGCGRLASAVLLFGLDQLPIPTDAKGYLGTMRLSLPTSLTIAGLLGVAAGIAGWHPARRAAAVQPVEALRHE